MKNEKKGAEPLQPYAPNIASKFGPFNFQTPWFWLLSSIAFSSAVIFANFPHTPGKTVWDYLTDGMPKRGDLGFGRFEIYGVTISFEYPFRLAVRTIPSSITPWICFVIHQLGQWYIIYKARDAKSKGELDWTDDTEWNPYAWAMLRLNVFMIVLHYFQTVIFYDGLAGTFSELSTLFAGVSSILVAFIFKMRYRGFAFLWTPKAWKEGLTEFCDFVAHYHGYLSSFGMVLTFWYHTMETTFSHWTGFIHIYLLLWQSSLIYQKKHKSRYWTTTVEMWILLHSAVVGYYQGILNNGLHLMFLTSFVLVFLMGPMWGLPIVANFVKDSPLRYYSVLVSSLVSFLIWSFWKFWSNGTPFYFPFIFALPALYYMFTGWYYGFFLVGKKIDLALVKRGIKKLSAVWVVALTVWASLSIVSIMGLSDFIFRLFFPYGSGGFRKAL